MSLQKEIVSHVVSNEGDGIVLQKLTYKNGDKIEMVFQNDGYQLVKQVDSTEDSIEIDTGAARVYNECVVNINKKKETSKNTMIYPKVIVLNKPDIPNPNDQKFAEDKSFTRLRWIAQLLAIIFYYCCFIGICMLFVLLQKPIGEYSNWLSLRITPTVFQMYSCPEFPLCDSLTIIPDISFKNLEYYTNYSIWDKSTNKLSHGDFRPALLAATVRLKHNCNNLKITTIKNNTINWPYNISLNPLDMSPANRLFTYLKTAAANLQFSCHREVDQRLFKDYETYILTRLMDVSKIEGMNRNWNESRVCDLGPGDFNQFTTKIIKRPLSGCAWYSTRFISSFIDHVYKIELL